MLETENKENNSEVDEAKETHAEMKAKETSLAKQTTEPSVEQYSQESCQEKCKKRYLASVSCRCNKWKIKAWLLAMTLTVFGIVFIAIYFTRPIYSFDDVPNYHGRLGDCYGNDIKSISGEGVAFKTCINRCNSNPSCVAFTWVPGNKGCWCKSKSCSDAGGTPHSMIYEKITGVNVDGYSVRVGDCTGAGITVLPVPNNIGLSLQGCKQRCDRNHNCRGFTYVHGSNSCYPKNNVCAKTSSSKGVHFYNKIGGSNTGGTSDSFTKMYGDCYGNDLSLGKAKISVSECEYRCSASSRCVAFTYLKNLGECYPKHKCEDFQSHPPVSGLELYVKVDKSKTKPEVDIWVTTANQKLRLALKSLEKGSRGETITVDSNRKYQSILGFGAALSNSAAYLIYNSPKRADILADLFSPTGLKISYMRLVLGGSDFQAVPPYTYDDLQWGEDFNMDRFSIDKDRAFVIPVVKEILKVNPKLKILGTPWSAPGWMKTSGKLNGGYLKSDDRYLRAYAKYFVRFVQEYAKEGIQIHALTFQNEPGHSSNDYPTMKVPCDLQRRFMGDYLGPAFRSANIATKIIAYDHNWDGVDCVLQILSNTKAKSYIAGSGWHCYGGDSRGPLRVHNAHPDKEIYFTECSGGDWDSKFDSTFMWQTQKVFMDQLKNYARAVMLWNLALDENDGPKVNVGGCANCRGVITVKGGSYTREVEYYVLSSFSKFVDAGAVRIQSKSTGDLDSVAFQNPDGGIVIVLQNNKSGSRSFNINVNGARYSYDLPGKSVGTVIYH